MKKFTMIEVFTATEIATISTVKETCKEGQFARRICNEVIKPVIERINKTLEQEVNPMTLAYAIEYALSK